MMGGRKRAALISIDNLKKSRDENPTKRQKHDHPQWYNLDQEKEKKM